MILAVIIPVALTCLIVGFYAGMRVAYRLIPQVMAKMNDRELTRVLGDAAKLRREQETDGQDD